MSNEVMLHSNLIQMLKEQSYTKSTNQLQYVRERTEKESHSSKEEQKESTDSSIESVSLSDEDKSQEIKENRVQFENQIKLFQKQLSE